MELVSQQINTLRVCLSPFDREYDMFMYSMEVERLSDCARELSSSGDGAALGGKRIFKV